LPESGEFGLMIEVLEIVGTIAFAVSGAMVGVKKKHDLFGVLFLGIITSLGGGTLRDVLIGNIPPIMFRDYRYVGIAALVSLFTFGAAYFIKKDPVKYKEAFNNLLNVMDALGLGVFTIGGMNTALGMGYADNGFLVIFVGVLTGIGGGMLRDVLAGEVPFVLYKQVYALACVCGGILYYVLLYMETPRKLAVTCGVCCILLIRLLAAKLRWDLPRIT
jgi:uncharacterized membrane protein YeiH